MTGITGAFRDLLGRLEAWKIDWQATGASYDAGDVREPQTLETANAVCSRLKTRFTEGGEPRPRTELDDPFDIHPGEERHVVALDIDFPAHLIPSSTEGHYHLYPEVPGGLKTEEYMELLDALGKARILEPGYVSVSKKRGFTDLRLPWVAKEPRRELPTPRCCRCLKEASDIVEYHDALAMDLGVNPETYAAEDGEIETWVRKNEGTYNRATGLFACTSCYIAMGQPSGPNGWTPSGPDSIQPLAPPPKPAPPIPIDEASGLPIF